MTSSGAFVDNMQRSQAARCSPRQSTYQKPNGLPLGGGSLSLSVADKPFGKGYTAFSVDFSGSAQSVGDIYILGADNKNEIKAQNVVPPSWYTTELRWDSWLACNGKLYWLAYDSNPQFGILLPYNQGCQAVRLYAEPEDQTFVPDPSAPDYKYYQDCIAKTGNSTAKPSRRSFEAEEEQSGSERIRLV